MVKCRPTIRLLVVGFGLIGIVCAAFTLGRMTGLSMAWYHWRSEYKDPLSEWQSELNDRLKAGDTNGVIEIIQKFGVENVQAYGREQLFEQSNFRLFVSGTRNGVLQ